MNRNGVAKLCDLKTIKLHSKTCPRKLNPPTTNKNSRKNVFLFSFKFFIFSCHADYLILLLSFISCFFFRSRFYFDAVFISGLTFLGDCLECPTSCSSKNCFAFSKLFFSIFPATPRQCSPKFSHFFCLDAFPELKFVMKQHTSASCWDR